jgi:hypothetical protein
MVFVEVTDVNEFWNNLQTLDLTLKYENIKLVPIRTLPWEANLLFMIRVVFLKFGKLQIA